MSLQIVAPFKPWFTCTCKWEVRSDASFVYAFIIPDLDSCSVMFNSLCLIWFYLSTNNYWSSFVLIFSLHVAWPEFNRLNTYSWTLSLPVCPTLFTPQCKYYQYQTYHFLIIVICYGDVYRILHVSMSCTVLILSRVNNEMKYIFVNYNCRY